MALSSLTLWLNVWLLRWVIQLSRLFTWMFGTAPYYTKFPPNRRFSIKSTCSSRRIRVNVYEPKDFDPTHVYPVYMNFHGSGFIIPSLGTDGDFCRIVSNRTGAIVLDCDYAKGPTWPFPAAPEDVKDIIDHVRANENGCFDTSRLAIGGFSSGAMLALTSGVSQPKGTLKCIVAVYPAADFSIDPSSRPTPILSEGNINPVPARFMQLVYASYMPPGTDMSDPRLSPINVPASVLPEHILIVVCEEDPFRQEGIELSQKLEEEGISVTLNECPGVVHGWDKAVKEGTPGAAARRDMYDAVVNTLKLAFKGAD